MMGLRILAERTGFALAVVFLVLLGFFQGYQVYSFTFDLFSVAIRVIWLDALVSSLGFAAFFLVSGAIFLFRVSKYSSPEGEAEGSITCIVPTYRDSEVLHRSVESLLDSNYSDFKVLIVCESDDEAGIREAKKLSADEKVDYLVNDKYPGSKAGAMNYGVENTSAEYVAFFDSDQRVRPDFISGIVKELQSHEIVQARNIPRPDGIVESLSYYESVFFTYVARQMLTLLTGFRLVGSRSVGMRREVFEELDGYSDDTLTEDYDFAHKCYVSNVDVAGVPLPVENLAAHNLRDWWGQRKRWMTGYFQVFSKMVSKAFRNFRGRRSIISLLIAGGSLVGSFLMLTLVSKFLILFLLGAEMFYSLPIAVVMLTALIVRMHDKKYNFVDSVGLSWTITPLVFSFFSIITIRSFFGYIFDEETSWYRVQK
ncbi:glycosyltransferase [Candidatus Nanohaloarchaea archaeon]|nr:glycosyltransferase [Candidatus Nanohaloarchaea archaeon]